MSLLNKPHCYLIAAFLVSATISAYAQSPAANYDEVKVGSYALPNPLVFENGKPVRSPREWKRRRQEIIELFQANVYGRSPKKARAKFDVFDIDKSALGGKAIRKQVTIYFSAKKDGPKADLLIYIPTGASKPVPMFLTMNFWGNHQVINDPGIRLPDVWNAKTHERHKASEDTRGRDKEFEVGKILARGYGFATIYYQDIDPDFKGGYVDGIRPLFFKPGQSEPAREDWGAIGAWSYGLSRAMDYLEQDQRCGFEARRDYGPLATREDGPLGGRDRYALRHGDRELFGRRWGLALPASLRRDDYQSCRCFSVLVQHQLSGFC